jgi:CRP-like cAMP-binding protein
MEDAIRNAPLFLALDEEASVALRASMVEFDFTRGQVVFAEGDPVERLYVIMDGKIKLGTTSNDGHESLLAVLGTGKMPGELSLFDLAQDR